MRSVEWLGQPTPLIQTYIQRGDKLEPYGRATVMSEAEARANIERAGVVPMGYSAEVGRVLSWYFYDGHRWTEGRPGQQQRRGTLPGAPKIQLYTQKGGQWVPYGPAKEMSETEARANIEAAGTAPLMYSAKIDMSSYGMQEPVVNWHYYNGATWYSFDGRAWRKSSSPVSWLGVPPVGVGAVPQRCFGLPDFEACYNRAYDEARSRCESRPDRFGYGTITQCITVIRDEIANAPDGCVEQFCATGERIEDIEAEDAEDFPWHRESPHTCTLQEQINVDLRLNGYQELDVDCNLGAKTCGAAQAMGLVAPTTCRSFEEPIKVGESPPPPPQSCPQGEQRDLNTGQCRPISCPSGQQLDPVTGRCITPQPTAGRGKKKDNTGLVLLGVAALAAGAFALI